MDDSRVVIGLSVKPNISNKTKDWLGSIKVFDLETFSIYDIDVNKLDGELLKFKEMCDTHTIGEVSHSIADKIKTENCSYGFMPVYLKINLLNPRVYVEDIQYANIICIYVYDRIMGSNKSVSNMTTCAVLIDAENFDFCIKIGCYAAYSSNPNRQWDLGGYQINASQIESKAEKLCGYTIRIENDYRSYFDKLVKVKTEEKIVYGDTFNFKADGYSKDKIELIVDNGVKSGIIDLRCAKTANIVFPPSLKDALIIIDRVEGNDFSDRYKVYLSKGSKVNLSIVKNINNCFIDCEFTGDNFSDFDNYIGIELY